MHQPNFVAPAVAETCLNGEMPACTHRQALAKGDALVSGLGSLSIPLGCDFGFQADIGVIDELDRTTYGAAAHLFTRDPDSYLFGVTGGYFDAGDTDIWAVGPEAELPMSIPRKPRLEPFRFDRSFRFDQSG